ncbi:MAG: hypothetical protein OSA78_01310 [Flavobacteriales bacterium]|nr:hypothetical protein [Flavobacteriales bacterium]
MIYLLLCIACSAGIFLLFRAFKGWGAHTLQAIVINYGVAALLGWTLSGGFSTLKMAWGTPWVNTAMAVGILFIYLFHLIARSTQELGVTVTSIAAKLSMVIPVAVFLVFDPTDEPALTKLLAVGLAVPAVVLSSWKNEKKASNRSWIIPLIIFLGGGLIDLMFGWYSGPEHMTRIEFRYLFATIPFSVAFIIGLGMLLKAKLRPAPSKTDHNRTITWIGGIMLGVINFGSLYLLLEAFDKLPLDRSAIMPITNLGIVLVSSLMAIYAFKEKLSTTNWMGLLIGALSIGLLLAPTWSN